MTKILSGPPEEIIFVFESYDMYSNPIKIICTSDEKTCEISLKEDEAHALAKKLTEITTKREKFEG